MAGRHVIFERKMHFLQNVKENKQILFGAFSDRLNKVEKWKELGSLAKSVCLMPSGKAWPYARDTLCAKYSEVVIAVVIIFPCGKIPFSLWNKLSVYMEIGIFLIFLAFLENRKLLILIISKCLLKLNNYYFIM